MTASVHHQPESHAAKTLIRLNSRAMSRYLRCTTFTHLISIPRVRRRYTNAI